MSTSPEIVSEHVEEELSFKAIGRRHGVSGNAAFERWNKASRAELDGLQKLLLAGRHLRFMVPTGDVDEFSRLTRRALWVVNELHDRGFELKVRTRGSDDAIEWEVSL